MTIDEDNEMSVLSGRLYFKGGSCEETRQGVLYIGEHLLANILSSSSKGLILS